MVGGVQLPAYLHISQISVVTLLDHERSHNFPGYDINSEGLEDTGCRYYFHKLLVSFKRIIYD